MLPINDIPNTFTDLSSPAKVRHLLDMTHRIMVHYALWFSEVRKKLGMEKAMDVLNVASPKSFDIQTKRISKFLGIELKDDLPSSLLNLTADSLDELMKSIAVNWLANDGVWFQAVEFSSSMSDAKGCNDACWSYFSPFEAEAIKKLLNLPENCGLEGLKKALHFRLYACINKQSVTDETPDSFVFQMNECRVQVARKRKNLDDYPCKSGGVVEYTFFAETIDKRIRTACIGCPPDAHPEEWYCAWRFSI